VWANGLIIELNTNAIKKKNSSKHNNQRTGKWK
jgi:hypothetical protein